MKRRTFLRAGLVAAVLEGSRVGGIRVAFAASASARQFESPQAYGAIGDGASHPLSEFFPTLPAAQVVYPHAQALTDEIDWAAFQKAANQGNTRLWLDGWRRYRFNRQLLIEDGGFVLDGDKSNVFLPDMAYFTNNTRASELGATGCIILCQGEQSGSFAPLDGIRISGFQVDGGGPEDRRTVIVGARNVINFQVTDLEIYDFAVGTGIYGDKITGNSKILRNTIRDWYSDAAYGGDKQTSQSTGISIDDGDVNNQRSSGIEIGWNHILNLKKGATLLAALGWQTDGVSILNMVSVGHHIHDTYGENIGELVDCFGCDNEISNNHGIDVDAVVKIIHGASRNHVHHNRGEDVKRYHLTLRGTSNGGDVHGNVIEHNYCFGIRAGRDARACIDIGDDATGYACRDNVFKRNFLDPGTGGLACVRSELQQGVNYSIQDKFVAAGTRGYVLGNISALKRFVVKAAVRH
ncbi:hypothetical protein [Pararhizobium sp. A13]|uniref:hypothetical protein n=1 Tax=Pararhizobium sp. A13 TaxID=3133975 RepID=UPI00311ABA38